MTLTVDQLPLNVLGYFVTSMETGIVANPGGSAGTLCIAGANMGRYAGNILDSGATGTVTLSPDLNAIPVPSGTQAAMVGDTRCFQLWYRDITIGIPISNFSGASCLIIQIGRAHV